MKNRPDSFEDFLRNEVNRVKGEYYPVKAGFLRQALVRKTATRHLHPNPEDEFCDPDIGPNYGIISHYQQEFKRGYAELSSASDFEQAGRLDALVVEKAGPDGYLILNGHHRWAAALRIGVRTVRIRIVNLTQVSDIQSMLQRSRSDRRVTLDLDEVVFRNEKEGCLEKPLRFPLNLFYRERVRLGVPALLSFLDRHGYDIWVYTSQYYSVNYIHFFFKRWNVQLTGIITGNGRKGTEWAKASEEMKKLMEARYNTTIHIDSDSIIRTFSGSKEYEEYPLDGSSEAWAREAMDTVRKMKLIEKRKK